MTVAAERGLAWPGDVEVLLALASDHRAVSVLDEAGVVSLTELAAVDGRPAPAHAQVIPDRYNSRLRLGYGDPEIPVLRVVEHDLLIHMMVQSV